MRAIIDSDVLIDYLQGLRWAKLELERYSKREISIISWMEILAGAASPDDEANCTDFLNSFTIHPLSVEIAAEAVNIRRSFRIRLPDAIAWATARCEGCLLVTRNTKDFPPTEPSIRIPYKIRVI
ncbi:MAG TPA: type II toxin-antitoxin system VapC family toxin [Opitutaceae bacterium]